MSDDAFWLLFCGTIIIGGLGSLVFPIIILVERHNNKKVLSKDRSKTNRTNKG